MAAITGITTTNTTTDSSLQSIIPNIINEGGNSNTDLIDKTTNPIWHNNENIHELFKDDSVKNLIVPTDANSIDETKLYGDGIKDSSGDSSINKINYSKEELKDYTPPITFEDIGQGFKELAKDCILGVIKFLLIPVYIMDWVTNDKNNSQNEIY